MLRGTAERRIPFFSYICKESTQNFETMRKLLLILSLAAVCSTTTVAARGRGQAVIFETDMGNDIDDAMALDLLFKNMDRGVIDMIGISVH